MAKLPLIITFGQSNAEGQDLLTAVPPADILRWTGKSLISELAPGITAPGIFFWQPRMPYGTAISNSNNVSGSQNGTGVDEYTITVAGTPWTNHDTTNIIGKWGVITSGAQVGQIFVVTENTANTLTCQVSPFSTADGFPLGPLAAGVTFNVSLAGTQSLATYAGAFKPLSFYYPALSTYVYGVPSTIFEAGYDYPNHKGNYGYPWPAAHSLAPTFGPNLELSWQLSNQIGEDVWVLSLAVPGAYMQRYLAPLGLYDWSWFRDSIHTDWNPYSTDNGVYGLFDVLIETILKGAAKTWVDTNRPGDELDVQGIFVIEGESAASDPKRADLAGVSMRAIRDVMRQRIADAGLSSLDRDRIPFILTKIIEGTWTYSSTVNSAFVEMAEDDPYTGLIETGDLTTKTGDSAHWNAVSTIEIGLRWANEWRRIRALEAAAAAETKDLVTLADLRTRVRRRYERNTVESSIPAATLDEAINYAQQEIYDTLGDDAFFLRRIEEFSMATSQATQTLMPRMVKRLLRISPANNPNAKLEWRGVGYSDGGRLQVILDSAFSGTVQLHHMLVPKDLSTPEDYSLIPKQYTELVVLLACLRLAESGGNAAQQASWTTESARRWITLKAEAKRYDRHRQEALFQAPDVDYCPWNPGMR